MRHLREKFTYIKFCDRSPSGHSFITFHKFNGLSEARQWALDQSWASDGDQEWRMCTRNEYVNGRMNNPIERGSMRFLRGFGTLMV